MENPSEATNSLREGLLRPEVRDYEKTGYEQCWYPIAQSRDLPDKRIVGQEFLDGRVILYRDSLGKAHVMTAYCPHMGADLRGHRSAQNDVRRRYALSLRTPEGLPGLLRRPT